MDFEANSELIFGEEFCFPANATYYPTPYGPTGINLPAELYEHQAIWRCGDQDLHYLDQQAEGTSYSYYVVPDYGIAHSPRGPSPSEHCAIADGRFSRSQEYLAKTADIARNQPFPIPHYDVLPSAAQWGPASTSQALRCNDSLFIPIDQGQSFPVAPKKGITWNPSLQSTSVSSKKFENHPMLSTVQLHSTDPWKQNLAAGSETMVPAKLRRALQAPQHSLHGGVPLVKSSLQTNPSYNYNASHVGSDLRKMAIAQKFQPSSKPRSHVNGLTGKLSSVCWPILSKEKKPRGSTSSEIVATSYTSRLHIGNPEGKIIIRTDQYNRDDFEVVYPNAKFFVIKSWGEANVHKSIKYGVWSSGLQGNKKLDSAFRDAQMIAASSSSLCPVFLFFSVNESNHFCGVAEMVGPVDFRKNMDFWSQHKWIGSFPVRWHIIKNIPYAALRCILLQNNEDKPVTSSKNTQEIHYVPGTTMLKIFKVSKTNGCLLDCFTVYEAEEARVRTRTMSKLRRYAPRFIPVPKLSLCHAYVPRQPKADRIPMDRIIRGTHDLTGKGMHQSSWEESGNLARYSAKASAQKENRSYGKQACEDVVKAVIYQQPLASNTPVVPAGGQLTWEEVEVAPVEKDRPQTAANISSKAPEDNPTEVQNALVHSASSTPETIYKEKKIIGEPCARAISPRMREACPSCLIGDVLRIGSMLVPMTMPN
ncbi:hypothetical protein D1007_20564 [Hordeum vulgare]|uniref:YTH domain-containing family protein n=1 Tax=Hordeum vulgare subsp. vulgare TaxID=112509 RepID=F2EB30_HORVV|nr:uncharacterized protein LOC123426224 [Hordeum vulgare subsp. vulgare]XP_044965961.1 uncharacterized protein LOC123426224 [Hordeum vulgare subsp. vulgare]KAE8803536.1 hypothetical protein D1007_20564 [Hordeum vulgare]BAK04552.1 predicted protein [Hordeum vulgare subsp. vulgare]